MTQVISPTPGRIVWYYPTQHDGIARLNGDPLAAIVAGVHNDRLVNLAVFDAYGNTQQRSLVLLVQPDETVPDFAHATWMPYQVNQSVKNQATEVATGIATLPVIDQNTMSMFAETTGTSASETGLVNTTTGGDADAQTGDENTEAPAA